MHVPVAAVVTSQTGLGFVEVVLVSYESQLAVAARQTGAASVAL